MKEAFRRVIVWILTQEARLIVRKYAPRILLVTGSVGKTSAKDAAYVALSKKYFVRKSEKSFNSDIGAPLTVLGVPNGWSNPVRWLRNIADGFFLIVLRARYPEWLVLEVGADRPGDITHSLAWLKPEVVIATRFPAVPVHVEFYDSPESVQQEELAPLTWLRPGGVLVGNADDELVRQAVVPEGVQKIMYGIEGEADLRASRMHTNVHGGMPTGLSFDVHYAGERAHVTLEGALGTPHVYAVLAGIGGAVAVGVSLQEAVQAFTEHEPPPGRMRLVPGRAGSVIIDDSYNASPIAVEAALSTLASLPRKAVGVGKSGRKIAVLGDMLELGSYSVGEHERAGAKAAECADMLVTVGVRARGIAAGATKAGMPESQILQFDTATDAAEHLMSVLEDGDILLVKGSQGIRTEKISKALMLNPEEAKKYLPRQEVEWVTR